jgi:release factor glutamine methyltransferase
MLKELLRSAKSELESAKISKVDAELIAAHVLGVSRMELHSREFQFTQEQETHFSDLLSQRLGGIPLQYLTGEAPFRYLVFEVGPGVLIPRPETELLVDAALVEIERIQSSKEWNKQQTSIIDLGAGSGAIAISIAKEARERGLLVNVIAVEKEEEALNWLTRNIAKHEVDVRVVKDSVADALQGVKSDLVVANPPYISETISSLPKELEHEPRSALFGGSSGIELPLIFIETAKRLLKPDGLLLLEHDDSQSDDLARALASDFHEILQFQDLNHRPRWISARRNDG